MFTSVFNHRISISQKYLTNKPRNIFVVLFRLKHRIFWALRDAKNTSASFFATKKNWKRQSYWHYNFSINFLKPFSIWMRDRSTRNSAFQNKETSLKRAKKHSSKASVAEEKRFLEKEILKKVTLSYMPGLFYYFLKAFFFVDVTLVRRVVLIILLGS